MALSPSCVHTVEHLRPVLCLRSARSGVEGKNGVVSVVFPGEKRLKAHSVSRVAYLLHVLQHLVNDAFVVFLNAHVAEQERVLQLCAESAVLLDRCLFVLYRLKYLSRIGLRPEVGYQRFRLKLLYLTLEVVYPQCIAQVGDRLLRRIQRALCFVKLYNQICPPSVPSSGFYAASGHSYCSITVL